MTDTTSRPNAPSAAPLVTGWRRLVYRPKQRIMQTTLLFMAACGLGITAYAMALSNSVSTALILMAVPVAVMVTPLVILWRLPFDNYIDAGKHLAAPAPVATGAQDRAHAHQAAAHPAWVKIATSWWHMGVVFPAVCVSAWFSAIHAGVFTDSRTAAILFFWAPLVLFAFGGFVYAVTLAVLISQGLNLKGVSLAEQFRMLQRHPARGVRTWLTLNFAGAVLFMPQVGWFMLGLWPFLHTVTQAGVR